MRFKRHYPGRQAAVLGFVFKHRQHGLVATVHPVKVADGQRAGLGQHRVLVTAKDFHAPDYRFLWRATRAAGKAPDWTPERRHQLPVYWCKAGGVRRPCDLDRA